LSAAGCSSRPGRLHEIAPGRLADLVAYSADPFTVDIDQLPQLTPALTMVGGRAVHDPDGRVGWNPTSTGTCGLACGAVLLITLGAAHVTPTQEATSYVVYGFLLGLTALPWSCCSQAT
jgi:hypothetical protein